VAYATAADASSSTKSSSGKADVKAIPRVEAKGATGLSAEEEKEVRKRGVDYVPF